MSDIKGWILDALGGRPHSKDQQVTSPSSVDQLQQNLQQAKDEHAGIKAYSTIDSHPADKKAEEDARQRVEQIQSQLNSIQSSTPTQTEQAPTSVPTPINQPSVESQTVTPAQNTEEKAA